MQNYGQYVSTKATPQSQPIPGRSDMVENAAGGYVFNVDPLTRLRRFLVIGTSGGTYYVSESKLTKENAADIIAFIQSDGLTVVDEIVAISDAGRAPSNDPAIFALALCAKMGNAQTRAAAYAALPKVCRIGTHLFHFVSFMEQLGGWGRATRRAIRNWYINRSEDSMALQVTKYQSRDGWSHRDLLRLAHMSQHTHGFYRPLTDARKLALRWTAGRSTEADLNAISKEKTLRMISYLEAFKTMDEASIVKTLKLESVPMELVPTEKRGKAVYEAIYPTAGLEWLLRNLGNLGKHGILTDGSAFTKVAQTIAARFTDAEAIKKSRLHPIKILVGMKTYAGGRGIKGSNTWTVCRDVVDALESAFYLAFDNVEPTNKRRLLGLDVSGSMSSAVSGIPLLSCREAVGALAMIAYRTEPQSVLMAFSDRFVPLNFGRKESLNAVIDHMRRIPFGRTDCSLPMQWALQGKHDVDSFEIYTDNETWFGSIHPVQALSAYRNRFVRDARLTVVAMTASSNTIADPKDPLSLNVEGLDVATPSVIQSFIAGNL